MNDLIKGSTYGYQAAAGHVFQIHRARFLQEKLSTCTWGQSRHWHHIPAGCLQRSLSMGRFCVLTGFRCWGACWSGLWNGYLLCWTWRKRVQWVLWRNVSGALWGGQNAAAQRAALDGDGFRHVHTKQRAEGLRLRGAHAGHGSGLDPVSTRFRALDQQDIKINLSHMHMTGNKRSCVSWEGNSS